ncbi:hypothetical protein [Vogesella sp. LIG4]|nr:hypothetical protein [Vogesella sp. LIG4]
MDENPPVAAMHKWRCGGQCAAALTRSGAGTTFAADFPLMDGKMKVAA